MNCKKCGSPLTENDRFCKNCGASVNETNAQNSSSEEFGNSDGVNNGVNQQINQQPMYSQQPMHNQQPAWQSGYTAQPYNQPQPKNNENAKFIIIGIIIAVVLFAVIVVINVLGGEDNSSTNSGLSSSNNGTNTSQVNKSTYKVKFKGFVFNIPDNLVYEEADNFLMIGDEDGTWTAQIEIEKGSFAQIKANKSQLQSLMQQSGYTSSIAQEKTLGGVEFITLEVSYGGQNAIAALTKANSMYFMGVTSMNLDNEFDYSLLEIIAPIVSSLSYAGETTNMEIGTKLDMDKIAEIAK